MGNLDKLCISKYCSKPEAKLGYPKGAYLPTMISGKNAAREPMGRVNEANICPKITNIPI